MQRDSMHSAKIRSFPGRQRPDCFAFILAPLKVNWYYIRRMVRICVLPQKSVVMKDIV